MATTEGAVREQMHAVMRQTWQIGPADYEIMPRVLDLRPDMTAAEMVAWAREIKPYGLLHIEVSVEPLDPEAPE